jgi:hypothetical protein
MAFSRYQQGQVKYFHKGKVVNSSVGSNNQDNKIAKMEGLFSYTPAVVPVGYEHRPDLISNVFYGTPLFWFLILEYNNIADPFQGLNVGDIIKIPNIQ